MTPTEALRQQIARVIDPDNWTKFDAIDGGPSPSPAWWREKVLAPSLAKANAILALQAEAARPAGEPGSRFAHQPEPTADAKARTDFVNRFLAWKLPQSVSSDLCVTDRNHAFPRSGTNLLDAEEAGRLFDEVVAPAEREPTGLVDIEPSDLRVTPTDAPQTYFGPIYDGLSPPAVVDSVPLPSGDGCQFCDGRSGGVPGNGNIMADYLVCDYCTAKIIDILREDRADRDGGGTPSTTDPSASQQIKKPPVSEALTDEVVEQAAKPTKLSATMRHALKSIGTEWAITLYSWNTLGALKRRGLIEWRPYQGSLILTEVRRSALEASAPLGGGEES